MLKITRRLGLSALFLAVFLFAGCGGGNHAPTVDLLADTTTGDAPLPVHFTAEADDADGDTLEYRWEYFSGAPVVSGADTEKDYTYDTPGTYTARVTVSDGTDTAFDTIEITVGDPNLVANPGFELNDSSWTYYTGAARDNGNPHNDAYCVMFTSDANGCGQFINGGFSPGDTIKISCWIKGANSETEAYLVLNFYDSEGVNQGSTEVSGYVSGTYSQLLQENIVIPPNVTRMLIQIGGSAPASTVYADDVYVGP